MIYSASITIPHGTSEEQAQTLIMPVTSGLLWLFECDFPPGCCGLAKLQVFDASYQVFPASPGESFNGDNVTLSFADLFYKSASPYEFLLKTWNLDESWDHTVNVRIGMAMTRGEMSRYMPALAFDDFQKYVAELIANQEIVKSAQTAAMIAKLTG